MLCNFSASDIQYAQLMAHRSSTLENSSASTPELLQRYRWATQDPPRQAAVLAEIYRRVRQSEPLRLREDFAGNAADSVAWIQAQKGRSAIAVDIDAPTIEHARERARRILGTRVEAITFVTDDVHAVTPPQVPAADVLSVLNFSAFYFHQRDALVRYFKHAHAALGADGIAIVNAFGGRDAMRPHTDRHRIKPRREGGQAALPSFDYLWEQRSYEACSGRIDCRIHFEIDVEGGAPRRIDDAFRYDWRLWTLPELRECMHSAGFSRVEVWLHTATQRDGETEVFLGAVESIPDRPMWLAYVVGMR